jgi:hypothetical protein
MVALLVLARRTSNQLETVQYQTSFEILDLSILG